MGKLSPSQTREVKALLDAKAEEFNHQDFIATDPIQVVHQFQNPRDIEIIGLLIATIAWGNRKSIITNGNRLVEIMEHSPYSFVKNYKNGAVLNSGFVHRTFNADDLDFFFRSLNNFYKKHNSLEKIFSPNTEFVGAKGRIVNFRSTMLEVEHQTRSEKHLSNPLKNSAAKRINMFLRWMVRQDKQGVDFGIWKSISPSELMLPLDVHTGNVARKLGLLTRKQNDWKALEELMTHLRAFDNEDPVKYDFALFGLGAFDGF